MLKYRKIYVSLVAILLIHLMVDAQNSTNSPYTRYGYGALADRSFGAGRSMGGVGYGLRSPRQINPMNPASYSCMDSLTFLFDAGMSAHYSWFNDGVNKQKDINGNLEYLALQFPVSKWLAMSAGLLPYSQVGYEYFVVNEGDVNHTEKFWGRGGLNEVYVGASINIWKKRLAVGANVSYMFGNIRHESSLSVTNGLYTMDKVSVHNLKYDFGVQYVHPLAKDRRLTFGATYAPQLKLRTISYDVKSSDPYHINVVEADTLRNQGFDLPHSFGFGASYVKDYKLMLAADISYQNWANAKFFNKNEQFNDRIRIGAGGEYIPNNFTRYYLNRIRYRAGVHYSNSYLRIKDAGYNEYGVSLGAGFPMMDNRSFINASFEYVKVVPETRQLINEQYLRFTLSYTFNEFWFFKRKVD